MWHQVPSPPHLLQPIFSDTEKRTKTWCLFCIFAFEGFGIWVIPGDTQRPPLNSVLSSDPWRWSRKINPCASIQIRISLLQGWNHPVPKLCYETSSALLLCAQLLREVERNMHTHLSLNYLLSVFRTHSETDEEHLVGKQLQDGNHQAPSLQQTHLQIPPTHQNPAGDETLGPRPTVIGMPGPCLQTTWCTSLCVQTQWCECCGTSTLGYGSSGCNYWDVGISGCRHLKAGTLGVKSIGCGNGGVQRLGCGDI